MANIVYHTLEEMEQAARVADDATARTRIMDVIFEVIYYCREPRNHASREFWLYCYGNRVLSRPNAVKLFPSVKK